MDAVKAGLEDKAGLATARLGSTLMLLASGLKQMNIGLRATYILL